MANSNDVPAFVTEGHANADEVLKLRRIARARPSVLRGVRESGIMGCKLYPGFFVCPGLPFRSIRSLNRLLWRIIGLFFVNPAVAHLAWAQEPPKPSEKQTAVPTEAKQTPEVSPQAGNSSSTAPTSVVLREGTIVKLKLLHTLNTKTVVLDDPLNFSVAEDLVVDGKSVVKAGAPAIGRVRQAKRARTMGRGAELGLEMEYMKAGRTHVPLRGS